MSGPYFQKRSWSPFTYRGTAYTLNHLDVYTFAVNDTSGIERHIAVTFSDHCFTRRPVIGDDPSIRSIAWGGRLGGP